VPAVIDADALYAYENDYDALAAEPAPRIITPHSGELAAMLGTDAATVDAERSRMLHSALRENIVLLHKGAPTEVAGIDGQLYTIAGGDPAMARGGTGDVLTGLTGAVVAQAPQSPMKMTLLAAWLHAEAGRLAARELGRGLNSADLIERLPDVWNSLE